MDLAEPLLLWDLAPDEHPAYVEAGCGNEGWREYRDTLLREQEFARSRGRMVVLVRVSVAEILQEIARIGLACTPAGIMLALRSLHERQIKGGIRSLS